MSYSLILNPGSTSTKIGVFDGRQERFRSTVRHGQAQMDGFPTVVSQRKFREELILATLHERGVAEEQLGIVVAIGGMIRPGKSGAYRVNEQMCRDLECACYDEHASNLGALIAWDIARRQGVGAYVADAVTVDELADISRISGLPEIVRHGKSHTLNQKYVARMLARELGLSYERARLIGVHLGGGISVTAHRDGLMVDTNNARGEGPFCIDRAGGLDAFDLASLCFSGKYTGEELLRRLSFQSGVVAYLGTRDFCEVEARVEAGEEKAAAVFEAMAYQISKEIAAMSVALEGRVDGIFLTGGMANSGRLCERIAERTSHLGKLHVYPGEWELESLAEYADGILRGELIAQEY